MRPRARGRESLSPFPRSIRKPSEACKVGSGRTIVSPGSGTSRIPRCIMQSMIETALLALGSGAAAGMLALGVVLIYRMNGVINFALASSGTLSTFIVYSVAQGHPLWLAVIGGFLAGAVISISTYAAISIIHSGQRLLIAAIVSAAIAMLLQWVIQAAWSGIYTFPSAFPPTLVTVGRWQIPQLYVGGLVTGLVLVLTISSILFVTRRGTRGNKPVARPETALLKGGSFNVRSAAGWGAAGVLASLSGFFEAQIVFDHTFLVTLLPLALLAAALGGLRNIPVTFCAAVVLQVAKTSFEAHFVNVSTDVVANSEMLMAALAVGIVLVAPWRRLDRLRNLTIPGHLRV